MVEELPKPDLKKILDVPAFTGTTETQQKTEDLPKLEEDQPEEETVEISNADVLNALRELYSLLSNRFDQIYFKIDQTQDLIIQKNKIKQED